MGIVVAGFVLIGIVMLVLFDGLLHRAMEEPTEYRAPPSRPEGDQAGGKLEAEQARPEISDHP
jgi:hypothetical protein